VETEDVLPDEVLDPRQGTLGEVALLELRGREPLPVRRLRREVVLRRREVADRRVDPDVEVLPLELRVVHREPEVRRVARDAPVLQVGEPAPHLLAHGRLEVPGRVHPPVDDREDVGLAEVHVGVIARAHDRRVPADRAGGALSSRGS